MDKITVTSPLLPPLEELTPYLEDIWDRKWLTNSGHYHQKLEQELCKYLGVPYISLFSNGTLALITALQALELEGEVITTPYSFVATAHAIKWANLKPVFVDIDPTTFNVDPKKIEAAITDKTCAILPVHVYGNPCDDASIQALAEKYDLKVIYDAAHAFGVKQNGTSILNMGEMSMLSFHATKAYSTIEGGAIVCHTAEMKQKLDNFKNFGFESENEISTCGLNAKLNEVQAAFGLAVLNKVDAALTKRKNVYDLYTSKLSDVRGIKVLKVKENTKHNYSYFPILVSALEYGRTRDQLFDKLKENNIFARKYFYPLITDFKTYQYNMTDLPFAKYAANNVICLPIHPSISNSDIMRVVNVIVDFKLKSRI